jgi:hypothetical protein
LIEKKIPMSGKTAFPMLEVPRVPRKPRTRSMLLPPG